MIMSNHFPNQYYCNNNNFRCLPGPTGLTRSLQQHSTIIQKKQRSSILFLSDCIFPAFLPCFNSIFRIKLHLPPGNPVSSLTKRRVPDSSHSKDWFQFVFHKRSAFISQNLLGLEMCFPNSSLFYRFSVAYSGSY